MPASKRLLLVEDDPRMSGWIRKGLEEEGYRIDCAADGPAAETLTAKNNYDAVILDLMIPRKSGLEVLRGWRQAGFFKPVLILTAKDKPSEKVGGLDAGADDYLIKPFAFDEFLARIRALLRRGGQTPETVLTCADLELDVLKRTVRRAGQDIDLAPKEFAVLECLMRRSGQTIARADLADSVWGHYYTFSNVIDVVVARVRDKIDDGFSVKLLRTVRGRGYRLGPEPPTEERS